MTDRVICLLDMDCFYCQVETRLNPELKGLPVAVVQYNEWKGGGIIAVNYEARARGVTRYMRGEEAKEQCPEITLVKVPKLRDKADLSRYREAGREVVAVLCTFSECVERASVDEAYIDLTEAVNMRIAEKKSEVIGIDLANTFIVGYSKEESNNEEERFSGLKSWLNDIYNENFQDLAAQKLAIGAAIVEDIRKAVFDKTGFKCSAGIAHNKILAKLACGLHKPNRQTVVPLSSVPHLFQNMPVKKIRSLGGKLGDDLIDRLGIKVMADLLKFSQNELNKIYDLKTGSWLYNIARGYDYDPVTPRLIAKSIGCCKKFPGRNALSKATDVERWIAKLAEELVERLNEDQMLNKRRAQLLTISIGLELNKRDVASTKSLSLGTYNLDKIIALVYSAVKKASAEDPTTRIWSPPIKYLGLSAGKFIDEKSNKIINFFKVKPIESKAFKDSSYSLQKVPSDASARNDVNLKAYLSPHIDKQVIASNSENYVSLGKNLMPQVVDPNSSIVNLRKNSTPHIEKNETGSSSDSNSLNINLIPLIRRKEIKNVSTKKSFFEKILFQKLPNHEGKLSIVPDLKDKDDDDDDDEKCNEVLRDSDGVETFPDISNEQSSLKNIGNFNQKHLDYNLEKKEDKADEKSGVSQTKKNSMFSFLSSDSKKKWIDPEEIFPFDCTIDEDVLELFPPLFRKKIIQLKTVKKKMPTPDSSFPIIVNNESKEEGPSNLNINVDTLQKNPLIEQDPQPCYFDCAECGKSVFLEEKELHIDFHLAMKLDNELNHKSRLPLVTNKTKKLINNVQTNNKRKTKSNESKISKKPKGIDAFFKN